MIAANDNSAPANAGAPRFLSVCSGIEAASCAWPHWQAVAFAEIEKFPSAVLAYHYPDVPNLGDFTKIDTTRLGRVDILCGGTPCQAFSVAGARRGLDDARGNLTLSFVELAHELAIGNQLRNVIWENVPGVLSDKTNAFGCFLAGLVGDADHLPPPNGKRWPNAGMVSGPKGRAAWRILDAQYFGLAQRRRRVIVVADFGNGADPAAVLFEPEGVRRDSPPRREAGQGTTHATAPSLTASGRGVERTGESRGQDPVVAIAYGGNRTSGPLDVATAVNAHGGPHGRLDFESETFVTHPIAFSAKDYGADASVDIAPTLRAGGHTSSHANAGVMPAIAFSGQMSTPQVDFEISQTLQAKNPQAVAQTVSLRGREGGATAELGGDVATSLRASSGGGDKPHVLSGGITTSAVRRLLPVECERLQGFPESRKILYIEAWNQNSLDLQKNCASAETQSHKSQNNALSADESALTLSAQSAALHFNAPHPACERRVDVHALINFERNDLLLSSPVNSNWSVSIAEHQNSFLLPMPVEDFVQLIAHIFTIQERITLAGRAASQASMTPSSHPRSGSRLSVEYGQESAVNANDAELFMKEMDAFMKSITSKAGYEISTLEQRIQTSLSFATNVISSCIPQTMLLENSFSLTIETVRGYTAIPWRGKPASECPDGPRYKALGNSWAVPLFTWLGARITRLMPPIAANDNNKQDIDCAV